MITEQIKEIDVKRKYTVNEVAAYLKIHKVNVYKYIKKGYFGDIEISKYSSKIMKIKGSEIIKVWKDKYLVTD